MAWRNLAILLDGPGCLALRKKKGEQGMAWDRRAFVGSGLALAAALGTGLGGFRALAAPRPLLARVIVANDFSGDPDGLFQLAHHVLCRSVRIPLIIGTGLPGVFASGHDARDGAARAAEMLALMGLGGVHAPIAGSEAPIRSRADWTPSVASAAIVREAMRTDAAEPLVYASGAGLTDLALAWLAEPRIGKRIRLVWIGGHPHPEPGRTAAEPAGPEFNFMIDPIAAQVIFNESDIEIWQVPSNAYETMLYSTAELEELAQTGPLGAWLKARVDAMPAMLAAAVPGMPPVPVSDAYVLGDSPLVTLTALVPPMHPDALMPHGRIVPTPRLTADGRYEAAANARPMRVYDAVDAALTIRDMTARFRQLAASGQPA